MTGPASRGLNLSCASGQRCQDDSCAMSTPEASATASFTALTAPSVCACQPEKSGHQQAAHDQDADAVEPLPRVRDNGTIGWSFTCEPCDKRAHPGPVQQDMNEYEQQQGNGQPEVKVPPIVARHAPELQAVAAATTGWENPLQQEPSCDHGQHHEQGSRVDHEIQYLTLHGGPSLAFQGVWRAHATRKRRARTRLNVTGASGLRHPTKNARPSRLATARRAPGQAAACSLASVRPRLVRERKLLRSPIP